MAVSSWDASGDLFARHDRRERAGEVLLLVGCQRCDEGLDAGQAGRAQGGDDLLARVGDGDALLAAVLVVLAAQDHVAAVQPVNGAARGGKREHQLLGEVLERLLAVAREHHQQLELAEGELELPDHAEEVLARALLGVAEECHDAVGEAGDLGGKILRARRCCLHACKCCTWGEHCKGYCEVLGVRRQAVRRQASGVRQSKRQASGVRRP
jgi:hypothetical protein